jgi:glycosyltransferase involved in cell wall biosynthesis
MTEPAGSSALCLTKTYRPKTVTARSTDTGHPTPRRILFVGKNHLPYVGGSEISTHHLATSLEARGHSVTVLTRQPRRSVGGLADVFAAAATSRAPNHEDSQLGYPTVRSVRPLDALASVLEAIRPDAVVATCGDPGFARAALERSKEHAALLYVRDAGSAIAASPGTHFDVAVGNSEFVARSIRKLSGEAAFLPSLFPRPLYEVTSTREKVLFVNPNPRKGLDVALFLARSRPDIPFVFSLSWRMKSSALRALRRTARRLGNVEVRRATTDPRLLFRDCRLILVPTQVPEAWCRVVSETQINGIPSVASRLGGLPESVGPGGILVTPPDSNEAWLQALAEVWDNEGRYADLSRRALEHSRRREISVDLIVRRFEELLAETIDRHSRCG